MKRLFAAVSAVVLWGAATASAAVLPDYDAFSESTAELSVTQGLSGDIAQRVAHGHIAHTEKRLGIPTFFWAAQDPSAADLASQGVTAIEAARQHLFAHAQLYRMRPAELAEARVHNVHDTGRGAVVATFEKVVAGRPVFRDQIHVVMNRKLQLVALTGFLSPLSAVRDERWNLSRTTAVATAFSDLTGHASSPEGFVESSQMVAGYRFVAPAATTDGRTGEPRLSEPSRVKDVLFALPDVLVPAYFVELVAQPANATESEYYGYVVSALDGRILFRRNYTDNDTFSYRVWAENGGQFLPDDGPHGTVGTPHPTGVPDGYQAPFVAPSVVTLAAAPFTHAATDHWLPTGATTTIGNNVEAYADRQTPDGFQAGGLDVHATANGANAFDYTYDVTQEPNATADQIQAATTQLFYTNNFLHDWFYDHGFNEAAGNAQDDNYGRGGIAGDSMKAEAQDVGGTNNANMSTPPDGKRPRMQMYIFSAKTLMFASVLSPASIAGDKDVSAAAFGPTAFDLTADLAYIADGGGAFTGCTAFPAGSLTGKIALIDRGTCPFAMKAQNAQDAGAVGVLIANIQPGLTTMAGSGPTIPTQMILQTDGDAIKLELANGPVSVRMFREYAPRRDGTIDNAIVAHEWGHYISNRLIHDSAGLSNTQGRSMGEGWADFHALLMMVREADRALAQNVNFSGAYSASTYVMSGGGNDGFYYGLRRAPYSTDFTRNGLTFGHIENGVALPTTFPLAFGQAGTNNAEVHNSGEVWCSMLWEGYVSLLNQTQRLTFLQAQARMKDYLVAAYKATPASPTFLEARDALLAVTYAADTADFSLFAAAFARRGAGIGAVAPDRYSTTHQPTKESFLTGNDAAFVTATLSDDGFYCDKDGFLDNGETGLLTVTLKNIGHGTMTGLSATVTSTTPGVTIANGGQVTFGSVVPFGTAQAVAQVSLAGAPGPLPVQLEIAFEDPTFAIAGAKVEAVEYLGNYDDVPAVSAFDDVEAPTTAWTATHDPALLAGAFTRVEHSATDHRWFGLNLGSLSDLQLVSPPLSVAATGSFTFSFKHRFEFEADATTFYDGGVLEISADGGLTWTQIPATAFTAGGYNATLGTGGSNPLQGLQAWSGKNTSHPNTDTVSVDLGTAYAGQTVQVRFRIGTDQYSGAAGWEIDDLDFTNLTNTPFGKVETDDGVCINRPPVAVVGVDQTVDERTTVTLDGSGSTDADGDQLTLTWTQTAGPQVAWTSNGVFTAPEVTADAELEFELSVSDGQYASTASTKVNVRHVNRQPTAHAGEAFTVDERSQVTLDGSQSADVDGDALAYQWTQVAGPSVTLDDAAVAQPTLIAPEVMADTEIAFELTVTDGTLTDTHPVSITVKQVNRAPTVTVPAQAATAERTGVTLVATAMDADGEDAPGFVYLWSQTAGPRAVLANRSDATLTFEAPNVDADTEVTFQIQVWDGDETRTDRLEGTTEVTFTVTQANRAPVANAGPDRKAPSGTSLSLGGNRSTDPDGDALTYTWTQVAGPDVALKNPESGTPTFSAPAVDEETAFTYRLTVSDGEATSEADEVTVTVTQAALSGSGCGCSAGEGNFTGFAMLTVLGALALLGRRRRFFNA